MYLATKGFHDDAKAYCPSDICIVTYVYASYLCLPYLFLQAGSGTNASLQLVSSASGGALYLASVYGQVSLLDISFVKNTAYRKGGAVASIDGGQMDQCHAG